MVAQLSRMSCPMPDSSTLPSNCATQPFKYTVFVGWKNLGRLVFELGVRWYD
jgi:hypothetical protein